MILLKNISKIVIFNCLVISVITDTGVSFWGSGEVKKKPLFFQSGSYRHGDYVQFTFDKKGLIGGVLAGGAARTLVSVALCGNKFESFKSAVLRPGIAKSLLFWMPSYVAYRMIVDSKESESLRMKLKSFKPQRANKLNPFAHYPDYDEDEDEN